MLPGHHAATRCSAGLLLIVFEKYRCLTCRPIIQLSHHQNAAMAEWLRRLTRNQMGSSRVGSNPTRSGDSYSRWPDRTTQPRQGPHPSPTKARQRWDIGVSDSTPCLAALALAVCCSPCVKAIAGTSSNKSHHL